jgi:hypothetical protein
MNRRRLTLVLFGCALVAMPLCYVVGRARASGVPSPNPMVYSGTLEDSGTPVNGTSTIGVTIFDSLATGTGTAVCTTAPQSVTVTNGLFRVPLDDSCTAAVQANPNLYIEVSVNSQIMQPRTRLGAVPYAVESGGVAFSNVRIPAGTAWPGPTVISKGGKSYSVNAVYCGATAATNANLGGYSAAKSMCETACSSASAHVCTTEEMLRTAGLGMTLPPNGWYAAGIYTLVSSPSTVATDCYNFTSSASGGYVGATWASGPTSSTCNGSYPVFCCD